MRYRGRAPGRSALAPVALDATSVRDEDEGATLLERLGDVDSAYARVEDRHAIAQALPMLTARQREVLERRFAQDMKQSDIARELGCSQMQVSRLLRSGLDRLDYVVHHRSEPPETRPA